MMNDIAAFFEDLAKFAARADRERARAVLEGGVGAGTPWEFVSVLREAMIGMGCSVLLESGGRLVAELHPMAGDEVASGIVPGSYELRLSTGLTVWEGVLNVEDLLWRQAFPRHRVPIAASMRELNWDSRVTRREPLLGGELEMSVAAGTASGSIRLESKR